MTLLSKKLVDWLRYASITQGGGACSAGFFTGSRSRQVRSLLSLTLACEKFSKLSTLSTVKKKVVYKVYLFFTALLSIFVFCQPLPIAELDGTVSGDFFTVLCVGQGFTEDQWMNVYSFSVLRHWLLTFHSVSSGAIADTGMTFLLLP